MGHGTRPFETRTPTAPALHPASLQATDQLLWAVNAFGEVLAEVRARGRCRGNKGQVLAEARMRAAPHATQKIKRRPRASNPDQVFITPMPLLRLLSALGDRRLSDLGEAVKVMRGAMLDVIQV
jgi:hypothetical protein